MAKAVSGSLIVSEDGTWAVGDIACFFKRNEGHRLSFRGRSSPLSRTFISPSLILPQCPSGGPAPRYPRHLHRQWPSRTRVEGLDCPEIATRP
jgi:hypothetical protein